MADIAPEKTLARERQTAVEALLMGMTASAKTTALYKDGHPTILLVAERVALLLQKTLGTETTLTLDIKAKTVLFEETALSDTPELTSFAAALHTLGIGQVLFTNRLQKEGLCQFFKILVAKADEKTSLSDLQKVVQETRIDGLQLTFILNFVVTGEQDKTDTPPGHLSEEQVLAFIRAETLPDFLTLLLKQNEVLHGKEAESLSEALDSALHRESSVEDLEEAMAWDRYDPRIRARWDEFMLRVKRPPRWADGPRAKAAARARWTRSDLLSWASLKLKSESEALKDHAAHQKSDALRWSLARVHHLFARPASAAQPKFILAAYTRLLTDLGRDGHIAALLDEHARWQTMGTDAAIHTGLKESLIGTPFAERLAAHVNDVPQEHPDFPCIVDLLVFLGQAMTPLLLAELSHVQDKAHRAKLCSLLAAMGRRSGIGELTQALKDEDWFLIVNIVAILGEINSPACVPHLVPLLKHGHAKVRETTARMLVKFAGKEAVEGVLEYIGQAGPDESTKIIIALSLISHPGLGPGFIAACGRSPHPETHLAIITALGRFPSTETLAFLKSQVRRTWYEIVTGQRRDLVAAAKHSLKLLKDEGHA